MAMNTLRITPVACAAVLLGVFLAATGCGANFAASVGAMQVSAMAVEATQPATAQPKVMTNSLGMTFTLLPAGQFKMGSPNSEKERDDNTEEAHAVTLTKPFWIGVHEVTRGQFATFVAATGYKTEAEKGTGVSLNSGGKPLTWKAPGFEQADDHPVVWVSWNDAVAFASWLSQKEGKAYRLPSEAQWEYACRAGTTTPYACGATIFVEQANYDGNFKYRGGKTGTYRAKTTPVGSFPPNPWGLYDMHGNVWEWCGDWLTGNIREAAADPVGPATGLARAIRGGSWYDEPRYARSANRGGLAPDHCSADVGFRLTLDPVISAPHQDAQRTLQGLQPGDMVKAIDGKPVLDIADLLVEGVLGKPEQPVQLQIERPGRGPLVLAVRFRKAENGGLVVTEVVSPAAPAATPSPNREVSNPPSFTDVTEACGAADIIKTAHQSFQENIKTGNRWWPSSFDFVDLRGNGVLDLMIGGHGTQGFLCRNDGKGHFTWVDPKYEMARGIKGFDDLPFPGGELRLAYDLNEDGKPDLFSSWMDDAGVFYFNDTKGDVYNFKRPPQLAYFFRSSAVFDVDGDGCADFLCNTGDNGRNNGIRICFGDKEHKFDRIKETPGENWLGTPADLTGKGTIELVIGTGGGYGEGGLGTRVLRFNKELVPEDVSAEHGLKADSGYRAFGVMDLNHDGAPDLVCMHPDVSQRLTAWINDGQGHFTLKPGVFTGLEKTSTPKYFGWGDAVMVDLDNDGLPDVLVNGRSFLWVFRGMSDGTFAFYNRQWHIPELASSAVGEGRCFGDYDNDGRLDLVTCELTEEGPQVPYVRFRVLHNDLPAKNFVRIRPVGQLGNRAATGAKIRIYEPGGLGNPAKLLATEEVTFWDHQSGHSYYTAAQTERHFGLGDRTTCDVSVIFSSGKKVDAPGINANQIAVISEETGKATQTPLVH